MISEVKKTPEIFCQYVTKAGRNYATYKLTCDERELQDYLSARVPNELAGLDSLSAITSEYDLSPVAAMLEGQFGAVLSMTRPFAGFVSCRK